MGAFITLNGKDMKPNYTTYEAVVSTIINRYLYEYEYEIKYLTFHVLLPFQPHPNVKPMAYASSLMNLIG